MCLQGEWHAFPVLYQVNDLRESGSLADYGEGRGDVRFFRSEEDWEAWFSELVEWGKKMQVVPIVCGYNLMFDLQTVFAWLCKTYDLEVNAQSSTNVYTIDVKEGRTRVARFWDTYHLEMRGLAAMGQTAGLAKLSGDWDYSLVRTPETPLTDEELGYAARDVEVIPMYLRYLLRSNPWMHEEDLGCKVVTKTSLVRQMAKNEIAPLKLDKKRTVGGTFLACCKNELARCYYDYGLRKACFNGGWTFTAARFAGEVVENVASLDVTSMHHAYINGRYIPEQMRPCTRAQLEHMCESVMAVTLESALARWEKPFDYAFHVRVRFTNIRLRRGSAFERWGIALIARGKFGTRVEGGAEYGKNDAARFAEEAARLNGWRNTARGAVFAFGKLYSASWCELHVSEVELWCIAQVYEWDSFEVVLGEGTAKWQLPPDYVTLQSNVLFERKQDMKRIVKAYREGEPYTGEIGPSIPEGIAQGLRDGALDSDFVESYYSSTVKGMFNGIYGTQAQDEMKSDYKVTEDAAIQVDRETVLSPENFFKRRPDTPKVLYCYGMRIVGGSRMHMAAAMMLLYRALGERVDVTGGDTDSMKVRCDVDVTDADLKDALRPLEDAVASAIARCMRRVRERYPDMASTLDGIGAFDVEGCGDGGTRWALHMELWNKARVSVDAGGHPHVTCAGLSRPHGAYTIEDAITRRAGEVGMQQALQDVIGYNVVVQPDTSHALQRTTPSALDMFDGDVTDYLGNRTHVRTHEAIALYPVARVLGATDMPSNAENVAYVRRAYGRGIDVRERFISCERGFECEE